MAREPARELDAPRNRQAAAFGMGLLLWKKSRDDVRMEMDSELQVPGWGNIWTRPIHNRVDMLATGGRTMFGVRVYGTGCVPSCSRKGRACWP